MPITRQDQLALDRDSIRLIDGKSGHLHVSQTPISKANICPYYGREIPDFESLGLEPNKTYLLLRDPEELERAAKSFDGKPLLIRHRPQTAEDHDHDVVVGSVSNPVWDAPYLKADLSVWDGDAIKAIESNSQRQLSCGYFYRADMRPGTYQGDRYDGRMVDIAGNHVALVDEGRAGPDCIVGDSKPSSPNNTQEITMAKATVSRQALLASGALRAYLRPKLAQDAKLDLTPVLKGVTGKNWATSKPKIKAALDAAVKGKLAADADLEDVIEMLDQLDTVTDEVTDPAAVDMDPTATDADPDEMARLKAHLKSKGMSDEDCDAACAAMKGEAVDADPKTPAGPLEAGKPPVVTKAAMDAAITTAAADAARKAEASTIARLNAIRDAERDVRPYIGDLAIAQDSADAVYRLALDTLGVDAKGITDVAALRLVLSAQPKPGDAKPSPKPRLATDSAQAKAYAERFPHANRLAR